MISGVVYLWRDSLGLWLCKLGKIRKNAIILCWFLRPESSLLLKLNHNYKSTSYLQNSEKRKSLQNISNIKNHGNVYFAYMRKMDHRSDLVIVNDIMN